MDTLFLYERLGEGTNHKAFPDLNAIVRNYRHRSSRIGGYLDASFTLSEENLTASELEQFYNLNIGCRIEEITLGRVTWEGYISEMTLVTQGSEFTISLIPEYFRNSIWVYYTDEEGVQQVTAASTNDDSVAIFGRCAWIESLGTANATGATAWRDTFLITHAWPRSRITGGDSREHKTNEPLSDELHITLAGYWETLGWLYNTDLDEDTASNLITAIVGDSAYVTAGRIEANTDTLAYDDTIIPRRLHDLLTELIEQGDSSGNLWEGGVYAGRLFVYEQADTDWLYQLQGDLLLNKTGQPVELSTVNPGFLLFNANAPTGWAKPGTSSTWDDPRIGYVDEVAYERNVDTDVLRMHYYGAVPASSILARRMRGAR
jgi:hypothetical protein